jgi:hypothetical protein
VPTPYVIGKVLPFGVTLILAKGITVPVTINVLLTVSARTEVPNKTTIPKATLEADKTPFKVVSIALKYLLLNFRENVTVCQPSVMFNNLGDSPSVLVLKAIQRFQLIFANPNWE